ncbi:MAG: dihydrodipicolinate synthase family protein [Alphaproteobacteria bacterium]
MTASSGPGGVFAAALTPLKKDLSPDPGAMIDHFSWLLAQGCDGIAVLGTTGEANSFSLDERLAIIAAVGASGLDPARLLIGTGCCAIPDTVRLTRAALEIGAGGVLMLPPFYYKGVGDDGLFAAFASVIEQVADARLEIYVYHFPRMTGLDISVALLERLVAAYPETVVGLKDSSGDWSNTEAVCRALPGFRTFAGSETFLLPTLRAGGAGSISATANITVRDCAALMRARESAEAEAMQAALSRLRATIEAYPLVGACKHVLAGRHGRPEWERLRPPLLPLGAAQAAALDAALSGLSFELAEAA